MRKYEASLRAYDRVLEIWGVRAQGDAVEHVSMEAPARRGRAETLAAMGSLEEADSWFQGAFDVASPLEPQTAAEILLAWSRLRLLQGNPAEAEAMLRRGLARLDDPDGPYVGIHAHKPVLVALRELLLNQGRVKEAAAVAARIQKP